MPIDIRYRDQSGRIRIATVDRIVDLGDGYVQVEREHHTVIDPHTSANYIPKENIIEIRDRQATVADTDFHEPLGDQIRGAIDSLNRWRHGK